ncbi:beta strand repeat-containing protein [Haloferula sp.]|uniref:beta strand repeat-containing protein n=1 Tax=Haloferula sp. TaxID=2497595 RepID=UPI003C726B30
MKFPKTFFLMPAVASLAVPLTIQGASVVRNVATGNWATTTEWTDLDDSSNRLPTIDDTAIINQGRVVSVDSIIATIVGPVLINNTNDTEFSATINVNAGGELTTGLITLGAGNDEGFLNILGGDLNAEGVTITANNALNEVTVSSGSLDSTVSSLTVAGGSFTIDGGAVTTAPEVDGPPAISLTGGTFDLLSGSVTVTDPEPSGALFPVVAMGPDGVLSVSGGNFVIGPYSSAGQVYGLSGEINISGGTFGVVGNQGQMRNYDGPNDDAPLELSIIGDEATINIPRFNTNNRPPATINFVFDETGVSPINAPGFIHLANATVNIDGTAYTGGSPATFQLVTTANVASTSPTVNITGFGEEGVDYEFSQSTSENNFTLTLIDSSITTLVWEGDSETDDDIWSNATNWVDGVAPTGNGNESLVFQDFFSLDITNDLPEGLSYKGFAFENNIPGDDFIISGSSVKISEGISGVEIGDGETIEDLINLDIQLVNADAEMSIGARRTISISGVVSEDASSRGLNKSGVGTLALGGANTFTGPVTVNQGVVKVSNDNGLGSLTSNTIVSSGAAVRLSGGVTVAENLDLSGTGNGDGMGQAGALRSDGVNTLTGDVSMSGSRIQTTDETGRLTLTGTVSGTGGTTIAGDIAVNGLLDLSAAGVNFAGSGVNFADPGFDFGNVIDLNVPTTINSTTIFFDGYVRLGVNDAFATNADMRFGWTQEGFSTAAFDLNGFNQTLGRLRTNGNSLGINGDVNVTGGGTLTVNLDSGTDEYQGRITDGATPTVLIKDGAGILVINNLSGTPSNYTGPTTVLGGTLSLAQAELADTSTVSIAEGAVLELTHSDTDVVAALSFGGIAKAAGVVYNEANSEGFITGTGSIEVVATSASSYATWASGFAGLTDTNSSVDFEKDGLETGVEYVVGGDPTMSENPSLAPTSTQTESGLEFVFRRTDLANDDPATTIVVQYGSTLSGWTTAVDGEAGVTITVDEDGFGEGVDRVTVSLPTSLEAEGKLFARLFVTIN